MKEIIESHRRPKPDGSEGWIKKIDPDQKSFKQAMISIVFTGIWLEALLHLKIVKYHSEDVFNEYDFKSYEEKLQLLECADPNIIERVTRFRKCRKELVHEKAFLDDGKMKKAQDEADNAYELLIAINDYFIERSNTQM
jgi:hypothetical protein